MIPETYRVGDLSFTLRTPRMREADSIEEHVYEMFPDCLLFAAIGDRAGRGIDLQKAWNVYTLSRARAHAEAVDAWKQARPEDEDPAALAVWEERNPGEMADVELSEVLEQFDIARRTMRHFLPGICDVLMRLLSGDHPYVWPLPAGEEGDPVALPDGKRPLDDALLDLEFTAFADLLRAIFDCLGGFPGDAGHRFLSSDHGTEPSGRSHEI
ncbi:MAG: hypothetical protein SFU56_09235 [Capsulimonadales bacterium]|nr:hypothetical protein [Capsulimonadales bacterium]